jgi:tRNA-dihydrouridine synthase B
MAIKIRNITIEGDKILAPMAGVSDSPHRLITRKMGSAFSYSEFVSTDSIINKSKKAFQMLKFKEEERPIWIQIFGNNVQKTIEASKIIESLNPNAIDLNMGCSVAKVAHNGSGAGLLKEPLKAGQMIEGMRKAVSLPITAKIRLGWDHNSLNYLEVVHVLQESGVEMISVHGRTKKMGYSGRADWDVIAEIKSIAKVPIIGNGDILRPKDSEHRLKSSQVDAVLIGRGAMGNPWVFSNIDKDTLEDKVIIIKMLEHLNLMIEFYEEEYGILLFRKHMNKYLENRPNLNSLRESLLQVNSKSEYLDLISNHI